MKLASKRIRDGISLTAVLRLMLNCKRAFRVSREAIGQETEKWVLAI